MPPVADPGGASWLDLGVTFYKVVFCSSCSRLQSAQTSTAELTDSSVQLPQLLPAVATPFSILFCFLVKIVFLVLPLPATILHRYAVVCWEASISKGQWLLPKAHGLFT